ncbi:MAG: polysaccharide biosynthesis tyrosine autokinase [Planctomycetes bacterium]|nr:polysaccharide biosynthesis tyrosine autokinase [Planctomycetota bacterium]
MSEGTFLAQSPNDAVAVPVLHTHETSVRTGGPTGGEPDETAALRLVLRTVRRWWRLCVPIGLVFGMLGGVAVYVLHEPKHEASAWLRIAETAPFIAFESRRRSESNTETQIELIRSPLVLGRVAAQEEMAERIDGEEEEAKIRWLLKHLDVESVGGSELVKVSIETPEPTNSARIVNAIVDAYLDLQDQNDTGRTRRVVELLEQERELRFREVARLRETVRELTEQTGGAGSGPTLPRSGPPVDIEDRLANAELELEILKAQSQALEETIAKKQVDVPVGALEAAIEERTEVQRLREFLAEKRLRLHEIESKSALSNQDPFYRQLAREVASDEEMLERMKAELREQVRPEVETALLLQRRDELAEMRSDLEQRRLTVAMLTQRREELLKEARQLSGEALDLEFERAELTQAEEVFQRITSRLAELRMERQAPTRVTLLRSAVAPPVSPQVASYGKTGFASLLGLCLPFGLAVFWERMARRVTNSAELEEESNLTIVGEIPRLAETTRLGPSGSSRHAGLDLTILEESFDSLRTCLMLSKSLKGVKTLAVTSATNREGKTSVATQLALSIASASGEKTLLIDGDMRDPDVHKLLGVSLEPGLAEILGQGCSVRETIAAASDAPLDVLPAGRLPASPHRLFRNGALESLLDEIRSSYRYIVIDTPPILGASEALLLARAADACLFCAMWDTSRMDQVHTACRRLVAADVHSLGIVLSGVPARRYAYRYGNYVHNHSQR